MQLLNKIKIITSIIIPVLKKSYSAKLLEQKLNKKGYDIYIDHNFNVINSEFEKHIRLYGPGRIANSTVGAFTYVQSNSNISNAIIGRFCSVGPQTIIAHGEHPVNFLSTHPVFFSEFSPWNNAKFTQKRIFEQHHKVVIGHDVWIGANCYIKDGVNIGTGSILAAGSIVVSDVAPYSITGGVPAKIIKSRFGNLMIEKLLRSEWWLLETEQLLKLKRFFLAPFDESMIDEFNAEIDKLKK